jgi:hypothetical protein
VTDDRGPTTPGATASSSHDEELSSLLGRGNAAFEHSQDPLSRDVDCFPLDGVVDAPHALARTHDSALPTRSGDRAREVLARAELEVRDLLAQDPLAADWANRSSEIVARAQRQVGEILAQSRNSPEIIEEAPGAATTDQAFATLRAVVLPSEAGALRYRVSGQLTLATMLAFQYAVGRLAGVDSARVDPEPDDVAVLSMMTNDSTLVHRQLERIPGVHLRIDPA